MFAILNYTQSATVNRFGIFSKLPGILLPSDFQLKQINGIDTKRCLKKCMLHKKCLSAAFGSQKCILYSTDPRVLLSESSIVRTSSSDLTLWVVSGDFDVPCFVGSIEAYRPSDFENCGFGQKMTDSKCSEWSDLDLNYVSPCSVYAKILKSRSRSRNCTRPMFGGQKCSGTQFEEQMKYPVYTFSVNDYSQAEHHCSQQGKTLFTGLFWYTERRDELYADGHLLQGSPYWTGFRKLTTVPPSGGTKYSDPTDSQYVTSLCGDVLWQS